LNGLIGKFLLLLCAVKNEEIIAVYRSLNFYRSVTDPLLCPVGNWRYSHILLGAGNWPVTEEMCHWCVKSSVALPRRCFRVSKSCSVLQ